MNYKFDYTILRYSHRVLKKKKKPSINRIKRQIKKKKNLQAHKKVYLINIHWNTLKSIRNGQQLTRKLVKRS